MASSPPHFRIFALKKFYWAQMEADTYKTAYLYSVDHIQLLCMPKLMETPIELALQHIDSFLKKSENKFCGFQFAWILSTKKFTTLPNMPLLNGVCVDMSSGMQSFHTGHLHPSSWNPDISWHYFASL